LMLLMMKKDCFIKPHPWIQKVLEASRTTKRGGGCPIQ
jgi:hypothetical protein